MRIGYLVPEFPSQTHIFFWREVKALRAHGVQVYLISTKKPKSSMRHSFGHQAQAETHYVFPPRILLSIVFLVTHPFWLVRVFKYLANLNDISIKERIKLIILTISAADLVLFAKQKRLEHVHVHSAADSAHLLALFHLCTAIPYSITLHGDLNVYGKNHEQKFRNAKFVSCVTFDLQNQVHSQIGCEIRKLPVIRMGVDVEHFRPTEKPISSDRPFQFITVARLAACKGHIYALRALKEALIAGLNAEYVIVGGGEEKENIENEALRLGIADRVRLLGTAGEHEVLQLLQSADCFVLPSIGYGEAAPVSVMEAMACGLPVIASIIGGTPELISQNQNGILVAQEDVSGIKDAMLLIGKKTPTSGSILRTFSTNARSTAVDYFSSENFARQLLNAMQSKV